MKNNKVKKNSKKSPLLTLMSDKYRSKYDLDFISFKSIKKLLREFTFPSFKEDILVADIYYKDSDEIDLKILNELKVFLVRYSFFFFFLFKI